MIVLLALAVSPGDGKAFPLAPDPDETSLVALISDPTRYAEKRVVVTGFAVFEHETERIFLTREDAELFIRANSIPIASGWPLEKLAKFHGRYVLIIGRFRMASDGRRGYLDSIESMRLVPVLERFPAAPE